MTEITVQVTKEDVAKRFEGVLDESFREEFIETTIQDTVDKAAARWGARIQTRLDAGTLTENLYKKTIAEAVLRVIRNPEGYTTETEGNYSYGLRATVASGYLMFTPDNIEDLIGVESSGVIGSYSIGLGGMYR